MIRHAENSMFVGAFDDGGSGTPPAGVAPHEPAVLSIVKACTVGQSGDTGDGFRRSLADQILWLIAIRWVAVVFIVAGTLTGTYVFPVLTSPLPLYLAAFVLLSCNLGYVAAARRICTDGTKAQLVLAMVQMEVDLLVLTAVLHFSGGAVNPFFLFYVFHTIIATIILSSNLSFLVGITAIFLFGLLAVNELNGGTIFGYYPLQLSAGGGLWRNPVYALAAFAAFAFTVILAQHLTRMIIARMTAKEREAARNSDLLQAIINAMAEGLLFVRDDARIALCNPAARRWRKDNANGNGGSIRVFPEALARHVETLAQRDPQSCPSYDTVAFTTTGPGPRFVEAKSCPVVGRDGERLGYVIVGQDLTEHKRLESDLLKKTEQVTAINETLKMSRVRMAQREKMVALGQMASGIAHEIGNPLASLSSVTQYLRRKCEDGKLKEMCSVMDLHVERISAILRRMLRLARPATAEYKWVDVNELIDNTLSLIRFDRRARGVAIVHHRSCHLPTVWLNPQNVEQCLLNVTINALDAMDTKGLASDRKLEIATACEDETVEIRVSDTGVGMSPDICRRAFESFFTTKEISKGTGLGLFITYNLLAEIDGTIELKSQPGVGTTAVVRIPVRPKKDLIGNAVSENRAR